VALARRAAIYAELPGERASWHLRVGDTLRAAERDAEAGDAYRQALAERPDDRSTEAALRDIHRRLEEHEPLARLLEAELARVGGNAELPLRRELATLCAGPLERPADALGHLRRILEIAPREAETLEEAVRLAEATGSHSEAAELMDRAARQAQHSDRRAEWMTRRGRVLAETLGRDEEAAACFEAALTLVPGQIEARRGLRSTLEARGDWLGVLESYERELDGIPVEQNDRRQALIEEAAQLAAEHIGESAALPWLARQRDLCPDDANLLRRIAALHRNAGRHAALLGTIEDQLELGPAREARIALEVERARLLEEAFGAPARAAAALEEARSALPDAPEILVALDALYEALGRPRDRRRIVEARLGGASKEEVLGLRATAATLCEELAEPSAAADHLFAALSSGLPTKGMRGELLRDLAAQLERLGRSDLWARASEEELASLDPEAGVFTDRLRVLHERLHRAHEADGNLDAALRHGRALLAMELPDAQRDETERRVLDLLRRMRDAASLAALLGTRLARRAEASPDDATDADAWLELARLHAETMQRPGPAAAAFREVLSRRPEDLDALRGLRSVSERLGQFDEVSSALENEIALRPDAAPSERAALHRRLGNVAWHELDATTRASRAFAGALEADPGDLEALRSLQQLFETMEDWRGAADLYESEVTALGDEEPERRQAAWLRAGEIARDHLDDATRALRHFEAAAEASGLPTERQAEWAELYDSAGNLERFVDVFGGWLEAVGGSVAADQLRQSEALTTLGRLDDAIRHALQATEIEAASPAAWDALAALHDAKQEPSAAAAALDHAARLQRGTAAAQRHLAAAERLGEGEDTRAAGWLEDAVAADPALVTAHARLAVVASRLGCLAQAERAAEQVLAAEGTTGLSDELRFDALFAGARAARAREHLQEAARMLDAAGALMPEHPEVLGIQGRVLSDLGDAAGAREALQRLLAVAPASADRAAHLTLLASAEESLGDSSAALARFREAVAADGALDDAHGGLTRSLVQEGETEEAIDAFIAWADLGEGSQRGARLLQAAELELGQADTERAEGLLRDALDADPTLGSGWRAIAELLASQGRDTELIELSDAAFATDLDATDHARIALLRGRALEQRGDAGDAAEAFAGAAEHDPRCAEGALSAARLRRGLGSWQDAAAVLERFVERAPADAGSLIAPALHQLGRLRAGPLEDVEGAVAVYRRALEADPELQEAKEALADLLVHRPKAWDEAITRHRTLLAEHPTRLASLRALLRIARGRANDPATATGLALLRALGSATPDERIEAPARPPIELARRPRLATELGEAVRRMAQETASEIGEALGVGTPSQPEDAASDPIARFRQRVTTAAGALGAPALVPLPLEEVGAVLRLTAELGHEQEGVTGDGHLVNALSSSLTRRARRRIRKALGSVTASEVAALDVAAWRADLAAVAGAAVIDAGEADLRTAFLAWIGNVASSAAAIPPESDIREAVAASPEARAFLWRAVEAWHESL
jgi:Tfp pilus assembly protein PilF